MNLTSCLWANSGPNEPEVTPIPPTFTATLVPSATHTTIPTATPTAIPSDTPPATATPIPSETPTETPIPPSPTRPPTSTPVLNLNLTQMTVLEGKLPTPIHTPTATPVPRTVRADNAPDYTQSQDHLWFERPYGQAFRTWGSWQYPYGTNNNGLYLWHRGIDIQNPQGTPILAMGDGVVVFADNDFSQILGLYHNFYGQAVIVQHETITSSSGESSPVYTLYGHISEILVRRGDSVSRGQPIALTGQGGVALGPHLHLEIRLGNALGYRNTQNPDLWIRPDSGYGVIAGRVVDAVGYYVPQQLITLHHASSPNTFWRQTRTYPDNRYSSDPQLGETFTFSDVPVGDYVLKTSFDGTNFTYPVTVRNQAASFVFIDGGSSP